MKSLVLFFFIISSLLFFSCNKEAAEQVQFDSEYLPDGVERVAHEIYEPTGENFSSPRVDPPSWWIGMGMDTIDLLVYNESIDDCSISIRGNGLTVLKQRNLENPNYKIISLHISEEAAPGKYNLIFNCEGDSKTPLSFSLHERQNNTQRIDPINTSDIMYLIMPDRFANGDTLNDSFDDMRQTGIYRDKIYFRHGGDLQGIINHLDYLEELGITSIWLNPVQENDMPYSSYHGYANTDHYLIDKRFGSNEKYRELSDALQSRGMKLVMDIVPNHCGTYHYFIQDIPAKDWINQFDEFTWSIHSHPTVRDPYATEDDRIKHFNGWFDRSMPDFNHSNRDVSTYLIQSYIWWVEYAGLDGFRIDTYQYVNQDFMHEMNKQILKEYPGFHLFAENWVYDRALQAQYVSGSALQEDFESYLPATADFQWAFSVKEVCGEKAEWGKGVQKLHYTHGSHYLYDNPLNNIIFLDNHDMDRFYTVVNEDWNAFESGLNLLFTSPGIPCFYYGTELLHKYKASPDGQVRLDIKGGWPSDSENHFSKEGRSSLQNQAFETIKKLIKERRSNPLFLKSRFRHYSPRDFVYSYFYSDETSCLQFIINGNDEAKQIDLQRFDEILKDFSRGNIIQTGKVIDYPSFIDLDTKQSVIIRWSQ
jgi:glycosidase